MDLIANPKMLVSIRKVQGKDTIWVHCNIRVKIVDRVGDLPGYGTVCYKLTRISKILSMSRATRKFTVFFNIEGRIFFSMVILDREVSFHLSPNGLYYFDAADRENSALLLNTVSENQEWFTRRE